MRFILKAVSIIFDPRRLYNHMKVLKGIFLRSGFRGVWWYFLSKILSCRLYLEVQKLLGHDGTVKVKTDEVVMYVDINDVGISNDLFLYGRREVEATRVFKSFLKPGQTVIDIGANIGYYALIEAGLIMASGRIYAIEPSPNNLRILKKSIELNNYSDFVNVELGAISDKSGTAKLHLAERSNLHTLNRVPVMDDYVKFKETIEVPMFSIDDFVKIKKIKPSSIDVIRMDIEGHEVEAFEGMTQTLNEIGAVVVFIEIHPKLIKEVSKQKYINFIKKLESYNFKIEGCALSLSSREDQLINISNLDELLDYHDAVELILRKL